MAAELIITNMVTGAKEFIQGHLGAYLAAIDPRLQMPELELGYKELAGRTKYPAGVFVPVPFDQEDSGNDSSLISVNVELGIAITDARPQQLALKLMWHADAIMGLIRDEYALGGSCLLSSVIDGTMLQGDPGRKDLGIVFATIRLTTEAAAS